MLGLPVVGEDPMGGVGFWVNRDANEALKFELTIAKAWWLFANCADELK